MADKTHDRAVEMAEMAAGYFDHADDAEFITNFTKDLEAVIAEAVAEAGTPPLGGF